MNKKFSFRKCNRCGYRTPEPIYKDLPGGVFWGVEGDNIKGDFCPRCYFKFLEEHIGKMEKEAEDD